MPPPDLMPPRDHFLPAPPTPYINYCLIALNLVVFAWELSLGANLPKATEVFGFVPARFVGYFRQGGLTFSQGVMPLVTSLFVHGNVLHIMPNMGFLFIFGGTVEEVLGPGRYLSFYLAGGVGAGLIYLSFSPNSTIPLIGASGAIAAVMAAYLSLFPEAKFATLLIIAWVLLQFLYGTFALVHNATGLPGMAWWAHVGGFVLGLVLIRFFAPAAVRLIPWRSRPQKPPEA